VAGSLRIVVMEGLFADYPAKVRSALRSLGEDAEVETFPHLYSRELTGERLARIRNLLRRQTKDELLFFFPGALELFLDEPDMSFHCSAYRSWFDPERMTVIPHPWSSVRPGPDRNAVRWRTKPECSIGFMGSTYSGSRGGRIAAALPAFARRWLLEGRIRQNAGLVTWLYERKIPFHYLPTFARFEALEAVADASKQVGTKLEIVDTAGFDGSQASTRAFADHLSRTTYVLCPRGCENYSFRVYEALRFGRVPVIINTDMVLPSGIDWQRIALIVPGDAPQDIHAKIVDDYRHLDGTEFLERQSAAFETSDYLDGEGWLAASISDALPQGGLGFAHGPELKCVRRP